MLTYSSLRSSQLQDSKIDVERFSEKVERAIKVAKDLDESCSRIGARVLDFASWGGREFQTNQVKIDELDKDMDAFVKEKLEMNGEQYLDQQYARFVKEEESLGLPNRRESNPNEVTIERSESAMTNGKNEVYWVKDDVTGSVRTKEEGNDISAKNETSFADGEWE